MTLEALSEDLGAYHLQVLGAFHPRSADRVPVSCKTLVLVGPRSPGFWPAFEASREWQDSLPDPMDRWSQRVLDRVAGDKNGVALFPFGGPPFLPFHSWAFRTGRVHSSPVQLLVHDTEGLMVSFRGALALPQHLDLPAARPNPCLTCTRQPCRTACPVSALGESYDVPACKSFLDKPAGSDCMEAGCAARRACPVSQRVPRQADHSAYHMKVFKS
jgi:hypothetical protein